MARKKLKVGLAISGVKGLKVLEKTLRNSNVDLGLVFFNKYANTFYQQIKELCRHRKIENIQTTKIQRYKDVIADANLEVLFVVGWRFKIPPEISEIFDKGIIVFHDSLLPKYRGFAPLFWVLINGEKETGVTAFYIAEEIDSGEIIFQRRIRINSSDDINTLTNRVVRAYCETLNDIIERLSTDKELPRIPQDEKQATYCIWRSPEDAKINWEDDVTKIHNLIRASKEPFYLPYTLFEGKRLYILDAEVSRHRKYVGLIPGRVESIKNGEGVYVLAKDGLIKIKRAMLEREEQKDAWDIIKKTTVSLG